MSIENIKRKTPRRYTCPYDGIVFYSRMAWIGHMKTKHGVPGETLNTVTPKMPKAKSSENHNPIEEAYTTLYDVLYGDCGGAPTSITHPIAMEKAIELLSEVLSEQKEDTSSDQKPEQ